MGNTFGRLFRVTTFGESHGVGVGCTVDGCPAGLPLSEEDINQALYRRRPGQSAISTPRSEEDRVELLSGVYQGCTLGTPLAMVVRNTNTKPGDYAHMQQIPRPSHADFTYRQKYDAVMPSGGGRASARETIGRVAAGAVAEKWLQQTYGVEIAAWVSAAGKIQCPEVDMETITRQQIDENIMRCPDAKTAEAMIAHILELKQQGDSTGGIVTGICRHVPAGWGEPVFDKMGACLAHAMMSIPSVKGFEIGTGFSGTSMTGSQHNDRFEWKKDRLHAATNRSGGIQGGISNGETIYFRVALKPVPSICKPQETVNYDGQPCTLESKGRHDPCVAPRAVPVVEAMAAMVLADLALIQRAGAGI